MATKASPFAGKKLTESASPIGLDQRLFMPQGAAENELSESEFFKEPKPSATPPPADPLSIATTHEEPTTEVSTEKLPPTNNSLQIGKEGSREVGKEASLEGSREVGKLFDLSEIPSRKDSFLFTDEEFEAMDDLKLELRRAYALKATKNDLARCGIGYMMDDYKRRAEDSEIVRRLKRKRVYR